MRHIDANFEYTIWFQNWHWRHYGGRSSTRFASTDNLDLDVSPSDPSDVRLYFYGTGARLLTMFYDMRRFRSMMGYRAVVLRAEWRFKKGTSPTSGVFAINVHKYLKPYPDITDCRASWKDYNVTKWYGQGYYSQYGKDISTDPIAVASWDCNIAEYAWFAEGIDLTDYFAAQLRANDDLWIELLQVSANTALFVQTSEVGRRPKILVDYLFPIELYPTDANGEVDLTRLLNTDEDPINLGALQRGETSTPVKLIARNYSGAVISHAELWDDFPEWSPPAAATGNTGTGDLAHVVVFESCVSQKWTVRFSSASAFEVLAEAYLDNLEGLHTQYDGAAAWLGTTAGDWTSPDGSLRIPAAAWSGAPAAGDEFAVWTRGNTTDNTWPTDSNDMVEMCLDDGSGSPDGDWRPIAAQRTTLTAPATIDAATKTFTVKRIDSTRWPIGGQVFIANQTSIDEGTIKSVGDNSVEVEGLAVTLNAYGAESIVATTLPIRGLAATKWAKTTGASGASETYPKRIVIAGADGYGFAGGQTLYIQSIEDPTVHEEVVLDSPYSGYLLAQTDLVNDYPSGSFVTAKGVGEQALWMRVVATGVTVEELKEFRMNVVT